MFASMSSKKELSTFTGWKNVNSEFFGESSGSTIWVSVYYYPLFGLTLLHADAAVKYLPLLVPYSPKLPFVTSIILLKPTR